jgi:membrane fusion protein
MSSLLFRQESLDAGRQRLTGTIIAAVPPRSRQYTMFALAAVFAIFLVLILGHYARRVQVDGVVIYSAGIARVSAPENAKIDEVHVREGQNVLRGSPLVTISPTQGSAAGSVGVEAQLEALDRQLDELQRQKFLAAGLATTEQSSLVAQRAGTEQAIASLEKQHAILSQRLGLDTSNRDRKHRLLAKNAGTKVELEEAERALLAGRLEQEAITEKIIAKREQLATLQTSMSSLGLNGIQSGSQISLRISELARERANMLRQDKLTLSAPIDGIVGDIAVTAGQSSDGAKSIVSIIPKNSKLEVQLQAPSSAIGFVKTGQAVKLMFDAFPYQKYGVGSGTVTWVSTVPSDTSVDSLKQGSTEPMFRVRVAIDSAGFNRKLPDGRLRAGMKLSANLILEDRTLWEVFLGPILKTTGK